MNNDFTMINSRQKELLRILIHQEKPISYKKLSEVFKVSTRTIQREVSSLKSFLKEYKLKISKTIGSGIELTGSSDGLRELKENLGQAKTISTYSPEERWEGLAYDLLLSKEPIKQYAFSKKYGVTEATISNDLDKVSLWLEQRGINLERTPGVGVYIIATEKQRRTMLSFLLHKDITFEEWMELFYKFKEIDLPQVKDERLNALIRTRLLKFVHTPNILVIEKVVNKVLKDEQTSIDLTDRNYVNLIVHLMLAVERIKQGEFIEEPPSLPDQLLDPLINSIAEKVVENLENELSISIPKIELNYIVLHLAGARLLNAQGKGVENREDFEWIELAKSFIHSVELYFGETFERDELLLEGLVAHFVPAMNRLKLGLHIHNPVLEKVKEQYSEAFAACQKASQLLTDKTGYFIPESEIGYLTMHIVASMIREKERSKKVYQAVVVCASGLGTSSYLASQLRNEMPNLKVRDVISVYQMKDWIKEHGSVDVFISTVDFSLENENIVTVSPFLNKEDISSIQNALKALPQEKKLKIKDKKEYNQSNSMISLARYGEGVVQILRNAIILDHIKAEPPILSTILQNIEHVPVVSHYPKLFEDIEERERKGGFVLNHLAMIHARSEGVSELLFAVFRLKEYIQWRCDDSQEKPIHTFLLLVAPKNAPKEHIKMISEISAMLVEESFLTVLEEAPAEEVKETIENVLSNVYSNKAKGTLKE